MQRLTDFVLRGSRRHGHQRLALALLLGATLVAVGALGLEAWRSSRRHRDAAERVLRDYASFAVWSFSYRFQAVLYLGVSPLLGATAGAPDGAPSRLLAAADSIRRCRCAPVFPPRWAFRLDLSSGTSVIAIADSSAAPLIAARLAVIRERAIRRLADSVSAPDGLPFGAVSRSDASGTWSAFYAVHRRRVGDTGIVEGFEVRAPELVRQAFAYPFRDTPLLPRTLTGTLRNDSLASLVITNAAGDRIFATPVQYPATFASRLPLASSDGVFIATVALNPMVADRLLVGGLPRSPLPMLLALLTLATVLIGAAFLLVWRANELARLRTDFTSSVSHELRTPLTQILLYGEMLGLRRVRTEGDRDRAAAVIVREARRLIHLVENVLHFSTSERHLVRVAPRDQPLAPVIVRVVESFSVLAAERGMEITTTVTPELRASIDADALHHVLLNLLDNAARYGPPGQTIALSAGRNGSAAELTVDDGGPGIPLADRERIWAPFVRLPATAGGVAGSGIGLSVVRELVGLLEGACGVTDAPGGRARFWIHLPTVGGNNRATPSPVATDEAPGRATVLDLPAG